MKFNFFQTLSLILCVAVLSLLGFSACGNPRDGLKIELESSQISQADGLKKIKLSAEYEVDENGQQKLKESGYAYIQAKVVGGNEQVSRAVDVYSSSTEKVTIVSTYNPQTETSTITLMAVGGTASDESTYVTISSSEDSSVFEKIYVEVTETATSMDYQDNLQVVKSNGANPDVIENYAVFTDQNFKFDTEKFFKFEPQTAVTPNIVYRTSVTSNDTIFKNGEQFVLATSQSTTSEITIFAYNEDDPTNEVFQKTFKLKVLKNITSDMFSITRTNVTPNVSNLESFDLILSHTTKENFAELQIETPITGLKFESTYTGQNIRISPGNSSNKFELVGINETVVEDEVVFAVSYENILNSPKVLTPKVGVKVVYYPKAILVNGKGTEYKQIETPTGEQGYYDKFVKNEQNQFVKVSRQNFSSLNITVGETKCFDETITEISVFDSYKQDIDGSSLEITLDSFSYGYGKYVISLGQTVPELARELVIMYGEAHYQLFSQLPNGAYMTNDLVFYSGDVLKLKTLSSVTGSFPITITTLSDIGGNVVSRQVYLSFSAGITEINFDGIEADEKIELEVSEGETEVTNTREIQISVSPNGAKIRSDYENYITISSSDENYVEVSDVTASQDAQTGKFVVTAKKPTRQPVTITARSINGIEKSFKVAVKAVINTVTLEVAEGEDNISSEMKADKTNPNRQTLASVTTISNKSFTIKYNKFPAEADIHTPEIFVGKLDANGEIVKGEGSFLNIINIFADTSGINVYSKQEGTVYIVVDIPYLKINKNTNKTETNIIRQTFELRVFEPISEMIVSNERVEILASGNEGYYNQENQKAELSVSLIASSEEKQTTVKAGEAIWSIESGGENYVSINGEKAVEGQPNAVSGKTIVVTSKPLSSGIKSRTVRINVVITDVNNVIFSRTIEVTISELVRLGKISPEVDEIYFETTQEMSILSKDKLANKDEDQIGVTTNLKINIQSSSNVDPSNSNLEFFLIDCNSDFSTNQIKPSCNFRSESVWVGKDEKTGNYFVTPINAGSTLLYIVPQDTLPKERSEITLASLNSISNKQVVKISVADGFKTYIRVYDAQKLKSISENPSEWTKNYYIMNDIDVSGVKISKIGNEDTPFAGTMTSFSSTPSTIYGFELESSSGYSGIFGVLGMQTDDDKIFTAKIENLNFDISKLSVIRGKYVGSFAGKVEAGVKLSELAINTQNVEISSADQVYIGTIGINMSSEISNITVSFEANIKSVLQSITLGGMIAQNSATLVKGGLSAKTTITSSTKNSFPVNSKIGGVVGISSGQLSNITSSGEIRLNAENGCTYAGGIVAHTSGMVFNCSSSTQIANAFAVGGIVGYSSNIIRNCYYEIFDAEKPSLSSEVVNDGSVAFCCVGGLVGRYEGASIIASYVLSFTQSANVSEIYSTETAGGLVGSAPFGVTISSSYFYGKIKAKTVGGLVGEVGTSSDSTTITNTFTAGLLEVLENGKGALFASNVKGSITINTSYSIMEHPGVACVSKTSVATVIYNNVLLKQNDDSNKNVETSSGVTYKSENELKLEQTFTSNNFDFTNYWAFDALKRFEYPLPKYDDVVLYPDVQTTLSLSVKDVLPTNVFESTNSKNVIIMLDGLASKSIRLGSIFDADFSLASMVTIESSNLGVIYISNGNTVASATLNIVGTGSTFITVRSKYSSGLFDIVGIQVVQGYSDVKFYQSGALKDKEDELPGQTFNFVSGDTVTLQTGQNEDWLINYVNISRISGEYVTTPLVAEGLGTGVAFVLEDGYATFGEDEFKTKQMNFSDVISGIVKLANGDLVLMEYLFQFAFNLSSNAKVVDNGTSYVFSVSDDVWCNVNKTTFNVETSKKQVTLDRKAILNMTNYFAFYGSQIYILKLEDIEESDITNLLLKAKKAFSIFYSNADVLLDKRDGRYYVVLRVGGLNYAQVSQVISSQGRITGILSEVYMYVENTSTASLIAKSRNLNLQLTMVPYLKGQLGKVEGQVITSETENFVSYRWNQSVSIKLVIYEGASQIQIDKTGTETNPVELEISEDVELGVTLVSDSPTDQQFGSKIEVFEEDNLVASKLFDPNTQTTQIELSDYANDKYFLLVSDISLSGDNITENIVFGVQNSFKQSFKQAKTFKIVVSNYEFVSNSRVLTKEYYFQILPKEVQTVSIHHYADAQLEGELNLPGNYLVNAGAIPTDTILVGEMGLLRINVSPDYAVFDSIKVESNTVNGDRVTFQQRVAETTSQNGVDTTKYFIFSDGVVYIENGIMPACVTNSDGSFDGTIWLQTLIAKQSTTVQSFLITVTISKSGSEDKVFTFDLAVDSSANITLSYDTAKNLESNLPQAFVAVGTGGSSDKLNALGEKLTVTNGANKNILKITQQGEFESEVSVSIIDDQTEGLAQIEHTAGIYYVVVPSTVQIGAQFTVQVQGVKYVNGYRRTITRQMIFTTTDFVLKNGSLVVSDVKDAVMDKPYYKNAMFKITIGIDNEKINFNPTHAKAKQNLESFLKALNSGEVEIWSMLEKVSESASEETSIKQIKKAGSVGADYYYAVTAKLSDSVSPFDKNNDTGSTSVYSVIQNTFYIRLVIQDGDNNGWYFCPIKQNFNGLKVVFNDIDFSFNLSSVLNMGFTTLNGNDFFVPRQVFTLKFTQQTSRDSPIPIENLTDLLNMTEGRDYRLMADIDATSVLWEPLDVNIASLDGNGKTIKLSRFNTSTVGSETSVANYGLFAEIGEDTLIKNLTVQYITTELDLSASTYINFGGLAGINNGTVTNCQVIARDEFGNRGTIQISSTGSTSDVFNIAGLVAVNNASISNSRVKDLNLIARGYVAGFVSQNNHKIASSFSDNIQITNQALSNLSGASAGFVAFNSSGSQITTSYAGGAFVKFYTSNGRQIYEVDSSIGIQGRTVQIISTVNTGGFVYENYGKISDSFAGIALSLDSSSLSGGFVYANKSSGTIKRCYSVSYVPNIGASEQGNKAHTPFIGPTADYSSLYNENPRQDAIENCFFYDAGFGSEGIKLSEALGIEERTMEQFINRDNEQISYWDTYSTSRKYVDGFKGEEFASVWTFVNDDNAYFNMNNFLPKLKEANTLYFFMGPRLVSADLIAVENWDTVEYTKNESGEDMYTYTRGVYTKDDKIYAINEYLILDEDANVAVVSPNLIDSAETLYTLMKSDFECHGKITEWYRLVSDIDLSELTALGLDFSTISKQTFSGNFEGNGFEIKNLDISSGSADRFGLFSKIDDTNGIVNNFVSVQNLDLSVNNVTAALVTKVGALAGEVENVSINNINVYAKSTNSIVIGKNIVGGVIGKVTGTSRISNVDSSISVTAVFGNSQTVKLIYNADLLRLYKIANSGNPDSQLCYAGAVFGVVDLKSYVAEKLNITREDFNDAHISNIKVSGESEVIGTTAGGVVGLLGATSFANNIKKVVEVGSIIKAVRYAGGIVGENHGVLNYARLVYDEEVQDEMDKSTGVGFTSANANINMFQYNSKAIGGLVGINIGYIYDMQSGIIANSFNKVKVANSTAKVAGGLVGISVGGEIDTCYVTGSVLSTKSGTLGGAIGLVCGMGDVSSDISDPFPIEIVPNKSVYNGMKNDEIHTTISHLVAMNNWSVSDYDKLTLIKENGKFGGLIGEIVSDKISEMHSTISNEEYELLVAEGNGIGLSGEENFYVKEIYNYQPDKTKKASNGLEIKAVGAGLGTSDVATGLTRFEAYTYSYQNTSTQVKEQDEPDLKTRLLKQADRVFENWLVYNYGTVFTLSDDSLFYKNTNYDFAGMPIYKPLPNPDVIEIWTVEDYQNIKNSLKSNYVLMADLDFTGVEYSPIGSASKPFTGSFTGTSTQDGVTTTHVLYNITMPTDSTYNASGIGLFAYIKNATIKDVVVSGVNFSWVPSALNATSYAGIMVGYAEDSVISNVQVLEDFSRVEVESLGSEFTIDGKSYNISGNSLLSGGTKVADIKTVTISSESGSVTYQTFNIGRKSFEIQNNTLLQTWKKENILKSSAKYIGGLVGSYTLLAKEKGSILNSNVEAKLTVVNAGKQTLSIENNQFVLNGMVYTIDAFGNVYTDDGTLVASGTKFVLEDYNCTLNASKTKLECEPILNPEVYVGGSIGFVEASVGRNMLIEGDYFVGNIDIDRISPMNVGSFVGYASNVNIETAFANAKVNVIGAKHKAVVGGFAGEITNSVTTNVMMFGDVDLTIESNEKDLSIGGFAGRINGQIDNCITFANMRLSNEKNNWTALSSGTENQQIGGFAGSLGVNSNNLIMRNDVSFASIFNNSLLTNIDGFAYQTPTNFNSRDNDNVKNVYFDKYLSLTASDKAKCGQTSTSFLYYDSSSSTSFELLDANDQYSIFKFGSDKYPRIQFEPTAERTQFYSKYVELFENALYGTKIKPVQISNVGQFLAMAMPSSYTEDIAWANGWTKENYKWYIQSANLQDVPLTQNVILQGFYNGTGRSITTTSYDSIYGSSQAVSDMGLFGEIIGQSAISGVNATSTIYIGLSASGELKQTRIGIITANLSEQGVIFGSSTKGLITIITTEQIGNIVGGLVGVNSGQIIASSSKVDISFSGSDQNYFAVGGLVGYNNENNQNYTLKDCYFSGTINNYATEKAYAGGLIGKVVKNVAIPLETSISGQANLLNAYSSATIKGSGGAILGDWSGSDSLCKNIYYIGKINKPIQKKDTLIGDEFSVYEQRYGANEYGQTYNITTGVVLNEKTNGSMTPGIWLSRDYLNYGLPYLSTETNMIETGNGTRDSSGKDSPFLINNESQLVWALRTSSTNLSLAGVYKYRLIRDMDYSLISTILEASSNIQDLSLSMLDFKGTIDGDGHYILGSTSAFVGTNSGQITQLGFKDSTATSGLVANINAGTISKVYITKQGEIEMFANSGGGQITDCVTENYVIDTSGQGSSDPAKRTVNYDNIVAMSDSFDFVHTWALRPNNPGETNHLTTGNIALRCFVPTLATLDVNGTTGEISTSGLDVTLEINDIKQYSAILQYFARSGGNGFTYHINLSGSINMLGYKVPDLTSGNQEIKLDINGNNNTIYNFIIDDVSGLENTGLISVFNGTIKNLKFNQVSLVSEYVGGIVAGENLGTIKNITVSNSSISSINGSVGTVIGRNQGICEEISIENVSIISDGGTVGGVAGRNSGYVTTHIDNENNEVVELKGGIISTNKIKNLVIKKGKDINAIGGVVGSVDNRFSKITITDEVEIIVADSCENLGGIIGKGVATGEVIIRSSGALNLTLQSESANVGGAVGVITGSTQGEESPIGDALHLAGTINITANEAVKNLGGIIGSASGEGQIKVHTAESTIGAISLQINGESENIGGIIGVSASSSVQITSTSIVKSFKANININSTAQSKNIGGIVGYNLKTLDSIMYNGGEDNRIIINTTQTDSNIGGFAGYNLGTIKTAVSGVTINSVSTNVGGIVGLNDTAQSESTGLVETGVISAEASDIIIATLDSVGQPVASASVSEYVGGIVGKNNGKVQKFVINSSTLFGKRFVGGVAGINLQEIGNLDVGTASNTSQVVGVLTLSAEQDVGVITSINETDAVIQNLLVKALDGQTIKVTYTKTDSDSTPAGLLLAENKSTIKDVTFESRTQGSELTKLDTSALGSHTNVGLIGVNSGEISNINMKDVKITASENDSNIGFVGTNKAIISDITLSGVLTSNALKNIGMVAGYNEKNASIVRVKLGYETSKRWNLTGTSIGTVVGFNEGKISGYQVTGKLEINAENSVNVGGIVGLNNGQILELDGENLITGITITGGTNVGGAIGQNKENITLTQSTPIVNAITISGNENIGGFVGINSAKLSGTVTKSVITSSSLGGRLSVGGFVGKNTGTIDGAFVSGNTITQETNLSAEMNFGGLVGLNTSEITNSRVYATTINATSESGEAGSVLGGLVGQNQGTISGCNVNISSADKIQGKDNIGGIVGLNSTGGITQNVVLEALKTDGGEATSNVIVSTGVNVGGLVGNNMSSLTGTNSVGAGNTIIAQGILGGIVGLNEGTFSGTSAFSGAVNGKVGNSSVSSYAIGGAVGINRGNITTKFSISHKSQIAGGILIGGFVGLSENKGEMKGEMSSATVTFVRDNTDQVLTLSYFGAKTYQYGTDGHTNDYTDFKSPKQTWYMWYHNTNYNNRIDEIPTISSGTTYFVGVGILVGCNDNNVGLPKVTPTIYFEQVSGQISDPREYLNYYIREGTTYKLCDKNLSDMTESEKSSLYRGIVDFKQQGSGYAYVLEQQPAGMSKQ